MKIATITFHRALNYGAVLQTYALQEILQNMGNEVEVIDYRSEFIEKHYKRKQFREILSIRQIAIIILLNGYSISCREDFEGFVKNCIKTSGKKWEKENISLANKEYDMFVTGSDQVWNYNTAGFDTTYFLDFVFDEKKKNSYAASIGVEHIPEEYKEKYKKLLCDYNHISVREEQAREELTKLLDRNDIKTVLDPTLLLKYDKWKKLEKKIDVPEKYVLVYLLAENRRIFNFAKKLAKKNNCKIIYINDRLFKKMGVENKRHVTPEQWLYLFRNASYVVTNSFHGTAFSIIFKKTFWTNYLPGSSNVNSRITSLLSKLNLKDRIIDDGAGINDTEIEYTKVEALLDKEIKNSLQYIENMIKI